MHFLEFTWNWDSLFSLSLSLSRYSLPSAWIWFFSYRFSFLLVSPFTSLFLNCNIQRWNATTDAHQMHTPSDFTFNILGNMCYWRWFRWKFGFKIAGPSSKKCSKQTTREDQVAEMVVVQMQEVLARVLVQAVHHLAYIPQHLHQLLKRLLKHLKVRHRQMLVLYYLLAQVRVQDQWIHYPLLHHPCPLSVRPQWVHLRSQILTLLYGTWAQPKQQPPWVLHRTSNSTLGIIMDTTPTWIHSC